ncbi:MAG: DUF1932 domain-containing protein [Actinomycetota bacterium]|nr:DUF1932 domain-containing protein [Actinomycetota bacterium]MDQ2956207.1 DUF1932 domain-containing protein [Actinomycetota bacterium]
MTDLRTIAIVSPGAMGSALGRCWSASGSRVVATVAGRSPRTASLAEGIELLPSLVEVVGQADLVVSVLPPASAVAAAASIARAAADAGVRPLVLDLNAIAPATLHRVHAELAVAGCRLVDGSISGGPPGPDRPATIVYLSGPDVQQLEVLATPQLDVRVLGTELGTASAVKMCTASVYKGLAALFSQALQTAEWHGVTDVVLADLGRDLPEHVRTAAQLVASAASKSDRYPGEMRQIALTQGEAGAEPALFEAMATVFEAIHRSRLAALTPEQGKQAQDLSAVLADLANHP